MSRQRYEDVTRSLHVSDDSAMDSNDVRIGQQKLCKLGWLLLEIKGKCKLNWNLHQEMTVDESMIRYKRKYCPIRQYIPKKPTKWEIKVWALADAQKKYVYDFDVYTGSKERAVLACCGSGGAKSGYKVVILLMAGLHGRGHIVVIDNYFTTVKLTIDLVAFGTYAMGSVQWNRVRLPKALSSKQRFAEQPQGTIQWLMHVSRKICSVVWVDRQLVLLLSSFWTPVPHPGDDWPTVPRWIRSVEKHVVTSPVHKGYTKFMCGVDVAD